MPTNSVQSNHWQPLSLKEFKSQRKAIRNVNEEYEKSLSNLEKLAVWITEHIGTMGFFLIVFIWTILWLAWNTLGPEPLRFDPYPGFVLWLFMSNMIQLFLMPLIMLGQNLQGRHAEQRAEADFEVNKKAEQEVELILHHLEYQNELILKILNHLNLPQDSSQNAPINKPKENS
ncbi:MAG: DUF1003 domain-containing protein [Candidatus Eremiobacteraeota bacterium]|jgi:uncharacterized membrane protein|nr:DUF1003 domain-containing protein [Candidatus Eremiobacteraeota bacterium]MCL5054688.1 DUF1003 domain-containing protein [Bacillota bacterium]